MTNEHEFDTHATDPTRAEYYLARGAFAPEAQMRADFTVSYRHWIAAQEAVDPREQAVLLGKSAEIARSWTAPGAGGEWGRLDHAVAGWERYPRQMSQHWDWIAQDPERAAKELPIDQRTQSHARELTGHGAWERTSPERVEQAPPAREYPESGARQRITRSR